MNRIQQKNIGMVGILITCLVFFPQFVRAASETITVDVTLDSNDPAYQACTSAANDCSLRGAISRANANPSVYFTILIPAGIYPLTIPGVEENLNASGDLDILASLTLQGAGMETTILQAGERKGDGIDRVLEITEGTTLTVQVAQLTIQHGEVKEDRSGGGMAIHSPNSEVTLTRVKFKDNTGEGYSSGAGLFSNATTQVVDCIFSGNENGGEGGAVYHTVGSINFVRTTMMSNSAKYGGAFANQATATMTNVTISGNSATEQGGGISQWNQGNLTIYYTTIANNTTPGDSSASGIQNARTFKAYHSILAAPDGKKVCTNALTDGGTNLGSDQSCGTSVQTIDSRLGPLQNNGGVTWTHALAFDSPAVDAADPANCITEDQRGIGRPIDGDGDGLAACDIGAYESLKPVYLPVVNR